LRVAKRDRISIDRQTDWRSIIPELPPGFAAVGIVQCGDAPPGVLALDEESGEYVQLNEGAVRTLDQHKVRAALGLPGL
jgi:hypothetical protein